MTLSDDDSELSNGSYDSESSDGDCDSESSDEDCNSESQASGSPKRERDEKLAKDDLRYDLMRVLRYGFNFKGKFAFSMTLPYSPNPCLHIDGIGIVGLPLSNRDANLIASAGSSTGNNAALRDTVLIDSSKVSCKNPKWEPYLDEVIRERVWKKLGCPPYKTAPHYEFRKLLLQKPGSGILSFEDAQASASPVGTFSTVIIILPSEFTGGEIRASHGDKNVTLVSAKDSLYGTTLFAWYTDVTYEAETLTTGFRLALVYNLTHTPTEIPPPCIPSNDTLATHTRDLFRRWVSSGYKGLSDDHVAAYVLHDGDNVKKDEILSVLKAAANAENMTLLLGTLHAHVNGQAGVSTDESPSYGLSHGTFESPIMEEPHIAMFKVEKLTNLRGRPALDNPKLILDGDNLVPELPFRDIEPDEQNSYPFAGHGDVHVDYWYERPALLLFPSSKQLDVLLASRGVEYALSELERSVCEGQTKENQQLVEFIFKNWNKRPPEPSMFDPCPSYEVPIMDPRQIAIELAGIAVQSNDANLWVRTMGMRKFKDEGDLRRFGLKHIVAGWEKFRLEEIEAALDRIVNGLRDVRGTLMVLTAFQKSKEVLYPEPQRGQWLSGHLDRSFSKEVDDYALSSILEVACSKGLDYISRVIMPPLLTRNLGVPGWAEVLECLYHSQDKLLALPPSRGQTLSNAELLDSILDDLRRLINPSQTLAGVENHWHGDF